MKTLSRLILLSFVLALPAFGQLDQYGGYTAKTCAGGATGYFRMSQTGLQHHFCTPDGNVYYMKGAYVVNLFGNYDDLSTTTDTNRMVAKYGSVAVWGNQTGARLKSWGMNSVGVNPSAYAQAIYSGVTTKVPFILMIEPNNYGSVNTFSALDQPLHTLGFGLSPGYTGTQWQKNAADFFDTRYATEITYELTSTSTAVDIAASASKSWIIGIAAEDSDRAHGFGIGCDFTITGSAEQYLPWVVATMAPLVAWYPGINALYPDRTVYTKQAWADQLQAKYTTIGALNTAWGTSGYYTTFGTSGTSVTGGSLTGSGAGPYTATLTRSTSVDKYSVLIKVGGVAKGGDDGAGAISGPGIASGTINYATGAISVTLTATTASAVTADYRHDGWGVGTGVLDENGTHAWYGTYSTWCSQPGLNATTRVDLDLFLKAMADKSFGTIKGAITTRNTALGTHWMYMGPDSLWTYGGPPRKEVLQSVATYMDVMLAGGGGGNAPPSQAMFDFSQQWAGNVPVIDSVFATAGEDSALHYNLASISRTSGVVTAVITQAYFSDQGTNWYGSPTGKYFQFAVSGQPSLLDWCSPVTRVNSTTITCPQAGANIATITNSGTAFYLDSHVGGFTSQALRGQWFQTNYSNRPTLGTTSTGDRLIVGYLWWQLYDNWPERLNWGLMTDSDNAYDGNEATTGSHACQAPLAAYTCGGERLSYGDVITYVKNTNTAIDSALLGGGGGTVTKVTGPVVIKGSVVVK